MLDALMSQYLRRATIFFALIAIVPFALGFISSWTPGFGFLLFIISAPVALVALLTGGLVLFIRGIRLASGETKVRNKVFFFGVTPVLVVCTSLIAWPLLASGSFLGSLSRLFINRSHYEAIIANVQAHPKPVWFEHDNGITYSVDLGPPARVAFNPAGMLDNWSGIIYDPTGDVMLADGFDTQTGKFIAPDRITKLFEGDLVSCRHLWDSYYDCSFT